MVAHNAVNQALVATAMGIISSVLKLLFIFARMAWRSTVTVTYILRTRSRVLQGFTSEQLWCQRS